MLAHHLYQAGAAADTNVTVLWLAKAAKQAASATAFEEALAHLEEALSLVGDERSVRSGDLHAERAQALRCLGRMTDAIAAFRDALSLFKTSGETNRFVETSLTLGWIFAWMARLDEAGEVCRDALEFSEGSQVPSKIVLLGTSAQVAALSNDLESALPILLSLIEMQAKSATPRDAASMAQSMLIQSHTQFICARVEDAYRTTGETQRLCEAAGDLWGKADVSWIRSAMALHLARPAEAVSIAREGIQLSQRIGHWGNAFFCEDHVYTWRYGQGDLACAAEEAAMIERFERQSYTPWAVKTKVDLANVARIRGRMEEAAGWCARAQIPPRNHWAGYPHAALALTYAQSGDPRFSAAIADAMPYAPCAGHPAPYGRWPTLNLIIEALATAGLHEEAAKLLPVAEEMLAHGFAVMFAGHALPRTSAGIAAACAGQWERAEEHHQAALRLADSLELRVCQPIARYWYAGMLRARGETDRASLLLHDALAMFESLEMPVYARMAGEKAAEFDSVIERL
jgi:tetratricopeptide (TPR) repeat protein